MRATFARIHLENLRHNINYIRTKIKPSAKMCITVKADAYGHGAVECARVAVECGVDFLAVATVLEGIELRKADIDVPIFLFSLCQKEEIKDVVLNRLTPFIFDDEYFELFAEECKKLEITNFPVHLAVDTGMGRLGCLPEQAADKAQKILDTGVLKLEGMCTHFAVADSLKKSDIKYTKFQFENFLRAIDFVKAKGINPGIRHCANSAITLAFPDMHLDMCRSGITVYGYYPGDFTKKYFEKSGEKVFLKPVMELVSKILSIRDFEEGRAVSYGRLWYSKQKTKIAVLPIGYADGLFRRFNEIKGGLKVCIKSKPYPIRGRICMDQCMVDIADGNGINRFDEAVIFGAKENGAYFSAQELADLTGTISYEITCGISKRVPRVFIN